VAPSAARDLVLLTRTVRRDHPIIGRVGGPGSRARGWPTGGGVARPAHPALKLLTSSAAAAARSRLRGSRSPWMYLDGQTQQRHGGSEGS